MKINIKKTFINGFMPFFRPISALLVLFAVKDPVVTPPPGEGRSEQDGLEATL
jgi:hypothetical protein